MQLIMWWFIGLDNKSYEFTIPGQEGTWRTNYAWSLVENTPENQERLRIYQEAKDKLDEFEIAVNKLWANVITLKGLTTDGPENSKDILMEGH